MRAPKRGARTPGLPLLAYLPGCPPGVQVQIDEPPDGAAGTWRVITMLGTRWACLADVANKLPPIFVPPTTIVTATRERPEEATS